MARPKIDYIPKGLTVDLEEAYAEYFKQEVEFRPENKEDFLYMLRLLERWEKKSIPAVLAKGRPDAAYAIAMGLCEHLALLIKREDIEEYLEVYKQRIGKLVYAGLRPWRRASGHGTTRRNGRWWLLISVGAWSGLTGMGG